jgi:hypothetical protein
MKELDLYFRTNYNFDSFESLQNLLKSLKYLSDTSQPQYIRKASFLGYTTLANIIKCNLKGDEISEDSMLILVTIINNVVSCFKDNDNKIVCAAAECLYNIMKYFSDATLKYFNDIFSSLLLLTSNPDSEVKILAQSIDELLKETINYKFQDNQL